MYKYKSLKVGQLPQKHLLFLQNLLKQEVDDDLSVFVDCGISITGDIKIYQCHVVKR